VKIKRSLKIPKEQPEAANRGKIEHHGENKMDKGTSNDLNSTTQKTKDRALLTLLEIRGERR